MTLTRMGIHINKYLGVLEGADIMQKEMNKKVKHEYLRRVKLVVKLKLNSGNLITVINTMSRRCGKVQ